MPDLFLVSHGLILVVGSPGVADGALVGAGNADGADSLAVAVVGVRFSEFSPSFLLLSFLFCSQVKNCCCRFSAASSSASAAPVSLSSLLFSRRERATVKVSKLRQSFAWRRQAGANYISVD